MTQPSPSLAPAVWMISAAFCFASMGAFTHAVGSQCDWLLIAFIRSFSTFLFATAFALLGGVKLVVWKPRTLWWRSSAGTLSLAATFYALTRLPVADVLTLTNTYPLWIVLTSFFWSRSGGRATDLICVLCGILGVVLIQQPHGSGPGNGWAVFVALAASVSTAVAMLGLHRLKGVDARAVVAHFSGLASLTIAVLLLVRPSSTSFASVDLPTAGLLLGVGITGTLGQVLLTKAYAAGSPSKVAVLSLTQVVFGLGFDLLLYDRRLTLTSVLGFLMVVGPTAWVTSRAAQRRGRERDVAPLDSAKADPKPGDVDRNEPVVTVTNAPQRLAT